MTTQKTITLSAKSLKISKEDRAAMEEAIPLINGQINKLAKASSRLASLKEKLDACDNSIPDLERRAAKFDADAETKLHAAKTQRARIEEAMEECDSEFYPVKKEVLAECNRAQGVFERVCSPLVDALNGMLAEAIAPFFDTGKGDLLQIAKQMGAGSPTIWAFIRGFYMPHPPMGTESTAQILSFAKAFVSRIEAVLAGGDVWKFGPMVAPAQE